MEMVHHIRRLFSYDDWANREVLTALKNAAATPPRSLKYMAHILSAEKLWLERLTQHPQTLPVWPELTLHRCQEQARELPSLWSRYIGSLNSDSLSRSISYKNTRGESWSSRVEDILLHVVMHSVYHRGQIAADMRASGFSPAYTDFIHSVRQRLLE